jgi:hypothetical protein
MMVSRSDFSRTLKSLSRPRLPTNASAELRAYAREMDQYLDLLLGLFNHDVLVNGARAMGLKPGDLVAEPVEITVADSVTEKLNDLLTGLEQQGLVKLV